LDITLDENQDLDVKGLNQYNDHTREKVVSHLKSCKPEIIKKIKSGIEVEPRSQVQKMTVCKDGMPCKYIGLSSDEWGTYATCLYNNQPIHEPGFICPLANERFYKVLSIETDQERFNRLYGRFKPRKKTG